MSIVSDNIALPAIAGLAAGVFMIAIFVMWAGNLPARQYISKVTIPADAELASIGKTFEPQVITVMIGVNNTVVWTTEGAGVFWIEPNRYDDPDFAAATKGVLITPDHPFQYTFTKEGKLGYHSKPWMMGEVDVLSAR